MFSLQCRLFSGNLAVFLVFAVLLLPLDARDNSPTIWGENTIAVMKEQRAKLFNITLDLYNRQDYFDNAVNCVHLPRRSI